MRPHESKTDCVILDHAGLTYDHGFVDMAREWTLDGKKKRNNENAQAISVHVYENCFCTYSRQEYPDTCPECGYIVKQTEPPKVRADGELVELTSKQYKEQMKQQKRDEVKAAKTLEQLIQLGRKRGYKPAWAYRKSDERQKWRANHARK